MRFKCALYFEVEASDASEAARVCKQTSAAAARLGALKLVVSELYDKDEREFDAEGKPT